MATLTLRNTAQSGNTYNVYNNKQAPLTIYEVDNNFIELNSKKLEASANLSDLTNIAIARQNLQVGLESDSMYYVIAFG